MSDDDKMIQITLTLRRDGVCRIDKFYNPEIPRSLVNIMSMGALEMAMDCYRSDIKPVERPAGEP